MTLYVFFKRIAFDYFSAKMAHRLRMSYAAFLYDIVCIFSAEHTRLFFAKRDHCLRVSYAAFLYDIVYNFSADYTRLFFRKKGSLSACELCGISV